jgi:hypothetical protein
MDDPQHDAARDNSAPHHRPSPRPPRPRRPPPPEFTRRLLLIMAGFALCLKLVTVALGAMMVPAGAVRLITTLLLLSGLGYLMAYYFRRGPFKPNDAHDA